MPLNMVKMLTFAVYFTIKNLLKDNQDAVFSDRLIHVANIDQRCLKKYWVFSA